MPEGPPDGHPPLGGDGHDEVGLPAPHRLLHRVPAPGQLQMCARLPRRNRSQLYEQIFFYENKISLNILNSLAILQIVS